MKKHLKKFGLATLLGAAVLILTPLVGGYVEQIPMLDYVLPWVNISLGALLAGGLVALGSQWGISEYLE